MHSNDVKLLQVCFVFNKSGNNRREAFGLQKRDHTWCDFTQSYNNKGSVPHTVDL